MKPEEENSVFDILDDTQKLIKKSTGMDIRLPRQVNVH